ncbi:MAG: phospho-N-acetylmuramoyl-pentapeptide-transferase [Candidatus Vogelbacteria bacterium]|nr:phospho-N-acetylmuramoyl-pentapeptide-transferase [Candidatus Vogelbacteria bacterium]
MLYLNILKIFAPSAIAFFVGVGITPFITNFLYRHKLWKKKAGKISPDGRATPIFDQLHKEKEVGTPRMGGIIIWASVLITTILFWLLSSWPMFSGKLNFLSRNQTWLPLFTLIAGSLVGLIDDILQVSTKGDSRNAGLSFTKRLAIVLVIGAIGAYWFYFRLGMTAISIPFLGPIEIGWLIIPLFILVMVTLFSSGVIDGLDGLAGGVMAIIFSAYTGIAFFQNQIDLSAFCAVITGGILAFLWFNIPPARFYMSETGILGLTTVLTVIAFLTDSVLVLPIIALPLTATVISVVLQLASKKLRSGKKIFLVAPLHHHFEALGWPASKVVMRYWVIGIIFAIIGMILTLIK